MLFVGDDWAEAHHDIEIQDEAGRRLVRRRLPEGMAGIAVLHELIGQHGSDGVEGEDVDDPGQVVVGIETDRGRWVAALIAAGYQVYAINPLSVARYRQRHTTSGAKSDPGDAKVLADLVRTDRQHHRPIAGDSQLAEAVKVLARAHQGLCWMRGRPVNMLRSTLREFYPGALEAFGELGHLDALAVLEAAPTPARGRGLSRAKIGSALRRAGRHRNIETEPSRSRPRCAAPSWSSHRSSPRPSVRPSAPTSPCSPAASGRSRPSKGSWKRPLASTRPLRSCCPNRDSARSWAPGCPPSSETTRTAMPPPKPARNYAGTAPITRASGTRRVVPARVATNKRLRDALHLHAFPALHSSPGARAYYHARRADGHTHHQPLRAVSNRLVGILPGRPRHGLLYHEPTAWPRHQQRHQAAA